MVYQSVGGQVKDIYTFKFWKHKYGPELLVDIVDYAVMLPPIRRHPTFMETFYSVTIVLDADETISVDGASSPVGHGSVVTSIPGEVWEFSPESQLKGFNLAFEKEFLLTFFNDPHFLDRFAFLSPERPSPFLVMEPALFDRIHLLYREMQKEIGREEDIDQHILRAMLYETLMLLSRAAFSDKSRAVFSGDDMSPSRYADKFKSLVADNYKSEHRTEYYAERLFITPNYLNRIIRRALGKSAKEYIMDMVFEEACRLLRYTDMSIEEISETLGFETSTYFIRSFGKRYGITPLRYRKTRKE